MSDELGLLAHPRPFIPARDRTELVRALEALIQEESVELLVVGLPRTLDGKEGTSARRARQFSTLLTRVTKLEVVLRDEWLTTKEATARLSEQGLTGRKARERVDSAAATILLQSFLDEQRASGGT
jgi:putative holliday junction resolvase